MTEAAVVGINRKPGGWGADTYGKGRFCASMLVNAAGAWGDAVARMAGVSPLGLQPLRRTVIVFEPQPEARSSACPFTRTVGEKLVFGREAGHYFASALDEVPSAPCDARPDEMDIALAAYRVEERTRMRVRRISHSWSGLRTFAADRVPVIGFAAAEPSFFWLCGQGGAGIQASPALAEAAVALIMDGDWPLRHVAPDDLGPARTAVQQVQGQETGAIFTKQPPAAEG